jgi:ubiquitin C
MFLKPKEEIIFIKFFKGKTFIIEIKLSDTIKNLKMKIQNLEKIPISQQRLFFQNVKLKDDNLTLNDYKINHESMLYLLAILNETLIYVQTLTGKKIILEIELSMTIENLKSILNKQSENQGTSVDEFLKQL